MRIDGKKGRIGKESLDRTIIHCFEHSIVLFLNVVSPGFVLLSLTFSGQSTSLDGPDQADRKAVVQSKILNIPCSQVAGASIRVVHCLLARHVCVITDFACVAPITLNISGWVERAGELPTPNDGGHAFLPQVASFQKSVAG